MVQECIHVLAILVIFGVEAICYVDQRFDGVLELGAKLDHASVRLSPCQHNLNTQN